MKKKWREKDTPLKMLKLKSWKENRLRWTAILWPNHRDPEEQKLYSLPELTHI